MKWTPERSEDCAWNTVGGETVVVKASTGTVSVLSSTGGRIWEMCDGRTTVDDIVSRLVKEYDEDPETIREEVGRFLESMTGQGLIPAQDQPQAAHD